VNLDYCKDFSLFLRKYWNKCVFWVSKAFQ